MHSQDVSDLVWQSRSALAYMYI